MRKTKDSYVPSKGLEIITRNKKLISGAVIILYLIVMLFICFYYKWEFEEIYYISQIIGGIFVVSGLVISVLQYISTGVDANILREQEKKIKAAEMANNFQKELIPLMDILSAVYIDSRLKDTVLKKVSDAKLEMFNKEEILSILSEEEKRNALLKLQGAYLVKNYDPINQERDPETNKVIHVEYSERDQEEALFTVKSTIITLANSLEYFSIYFNSGIADDDTVYQSLHGVFFRCVNMLYPFIFYSNEKESDRLFSNVSTLYIKWKQKHDELALKEEEEINRLKNTVKEKIVVKSKRIGV